jgi:hypothetical protein
MPSVRKGGGSCVPVVLLRTSRSMQRATARLWREGTRWVIQVEIDGAHYTERDYADIADACHAIAQILRQQGERRTDLDEDACELCDERLNMVACSRVRSRRLRADLRARRWTADSSGRGRALLRDVSGLRVVGSAGWRSGHVAPRRALAARQPTDGPGSREGTSTQVTTRDVAAGGRPPGAARRVGAGAHLGTIRETRTVRCAPPVTARRAGGQAGVGRKATRFRRALTARWSLRQ